MDRYNTNGNIVSRTNYINNSTDFFPYKRDEKTLARKWAIPGSKGLEHRIGGLEKSEGTGNVSYDPENHHNTSTF